MRRMMVSLLLVALFAPLAAADAPRVLILTTSADHFPDGHPTGLWLEEFAVPYVALSGAGVDVTVVSPLGGQVPIDPRSEPSAVQRDDWGAAIDELGQTAKLDDSYRAADYDALFVPGGHGAMMDLAVDPAVAALVSDFARSGKIVAAICHGPAALVGATLADGTPLVRGKRVTSFTDAEEVAAQLQDAVPFSLQQKLTSLGARFLPGTDFADHVVRDGELITGQNPRSSQSLADLLVAALTASVSR